MNLYIKTLCIYKDKKKLPVNKNVSCTFEAKTKGGKEPTIKYHERAWSIFCKIKTFLDPPPTFSVPFLKQKP